VEQTTDPAIEARSRARLPAPDDDRAPVRSQRPLWVWGLMFVLCVAFGAYSLTQLRSSAGGSAPLAAWCLYGAALAVWRAIPAFLRSRRSQSDGSMDSDFEWPEEGEARSAYAQLLDRSDLHHGAVLLALATVVWITLRTGFMTTMWVLGATLVALGYWILRLLTAAHVRVHYLERPYATDRPIAVRVGLGESGSAVEQMDVVLRCVVEVAVTGEPRTRHARWHGVERDVRHGSRVRLFPPLALPERGSDVELTFEPPPGLPGTCLRAEHPTYWELQVITRGGAGRQSYRFLLPVYESDGS
jgi:hypothetical protein